MLNAPQWKSKIVGAWMQLLQAEDSRVLIRWIVPFVLLYVKCEPINKWPEQRQPERSLFVQSMANAITQSGVDHVELTKFIEELTQSAMPAMTDSRHTQRDDFKDDDEYQRMILARRIKRGLKSRLPKPRTKCSKCGRTMLKSSVNRHMMKFHFTKTTQGRLDTQLSEANSTVVGTAHFEGRSTGSLMESSTLIGGTEFFNTMASCGSTDLNIVIPQQSASSNYVTDTSGMEVDGNPTFQNDNESGRSTTAQRSSDNLNQQVPKIDHNVSSSENLINLWQFPSHLLQIQHESGASTQDQLQEVHDETCRHAEESDDSSISLSDCNTMESLPAARVLRHRVDLPKLQNADHCDLERIQNELTMYYQTQGRTSALQPKLLTTTMCRLLLFAKSEIRIEQLRYLDNALDVTLKTPRILIPYIASYTTQTPVASSIRNEVNRIRDLLRWRSSLLLIGSPDDLARRQMNSMEMFLKKMQSNLQRMVVVKSAEELSTLGMWSSIQELREAVRSAIQEIRKFVKESGSCDSIEIAMRFQQTVIACTYVSMRPQRRSVWREMKLEDLATHTYTTSVFKTSKKFQFLSFTFPEELYTLLQEWKTVFRPIIAKRFTANGYVDQGWLFTTMNGGRRDISSDVAELFFAKTGKILNPTRIRSIYRTEAQTKLLAKRDLEVLDSADCHGTDVVNRHYVKPDRQKISLQADQIYEDTFGPFLAETSPSGKQLTTETDLEHAQTDADI